MYMIWFSRGESAWRKILLWFQREASETSSVSQEVPVIVVSRHEPVADSRSEVKLLLNCCSRYRTQHIRTTHDEEE